MRQLVASWIEAEREEHGNTLGEAIAGLNSELGSTTTASRVSEWQRGVYPPRLEVVSYMLARTLEWAINRSSIKASKGQLAQLDSLIWVMRDDKGGEPYAELL